MMVFMRYLEVGCSVFLPTARGNSAVAGRQRVSRMSTTVEDRLDRTGAGANPLAARRSAKRIKHFDGSPRGILQHHRPRARTRKTIHHHGPWQ